MYLWLPLRPMRPLAAAGQVIRAGPDHVEIQGLNKLFADLGGGGHGSARSTWIAPQTTESLTF
jgi:hypothetical protein